ncbi:hypothetical protein CHS0354_037603 [Potamilus streckersoni]|uniref:Uncharacterized protein n=1 Tax=Potamilus streckersoni TaxID=2493646 RepID=A0AAE0RYR3_9BIVA|nr:hypothetical protein CHS0354_037603 [Potamilus streckersoni]
MPSKLLDLLELIKIWVYDFPLDKSQKWDADEIQHHDVNWNNVKRWHGPTQYYNQIRKSTHKTHVLFTACFTNDTDQPQVYTLKTERRTKSSCNIRIEKEASTGFKGSMSVIKADNETFEQELVWSVNNQITVPPKFKTRADLVIKEEEYTSQFQMQTKFEGTIHVTLRSKKDNCPITTLTGDVRHIFRADNGFQVDKTGIYFVSQGRCTYRFGIEQHAEPSQAEITEEDEPN